MQTIAVSSSLIAGAAYDEERQVLLITFKSGAKWQYGDAGQPFTADDAAQFEGAASKGKHFLEQIKGVYPERRV